MEAAARKHYQGIRRIWESVKFRAGQRLQRPKHGSQAVSSAGRSCGWDEPMTFKVRASFSIPMSTRELTLRSFGVNVTMTTHPGSEDPPT